MDVTHRLVGDGKGILAIGSKDRCEEAQGNRFGLWRHMQKTSVRQKELIMRVGIADHGGLDLKHKLGDALRATGYEVVDFGAYDFNDTDDYPDFVIPLARAVAAGQVERGIALCGSGVGASIAANKVPGIRAGLIHDGFSAHQGV